MKLKICGLTYNVLYKTAEEMQGTIGCGVILPYLRIFIGPRHMYGPINFFFYKYLTRKGTLDQ